MITITVGNATDNLLLAEPGVLGDVDALKGQVHMGAERRQLRESIARCYADGDSIREISQTWVLSYGKVRSLLIEAGVQLRPRGGYRRGRRTR